MLSLGHSFATMSGNDLFIARHDGQKSWPFHPLDPRMIKRALILTERTIYGYPVPYLINYSSDPWKHLGHVAGGEKLEKGRRDRKANAFTHAHAFSSFRIKSLPTSHRKMNKKESVDVTGRLTCIIPPLSGIVGEPSAAACNHVSLQSDFYRGILFLSFTLVATLIFFFFFFFSFFSSSTEAHEKRKEQHQKLVAKSHNCATPKNVFLKWWCILCCCVDRVHLLLLISSSSTFLHVIMKVKKKKSRSRKKKHLRNQKKKEKMVLKNKELHRLKRSRSVMKWCWSWSLTLLFLLLFVSEEFIVMVSGFDALPNGLSFFTISPLFRTSKNLCGILDIWIAGTYGTPSTEQTEAKDAIVLKYGEIDVWDVSQVTTMESLFWQKQTFDGDISKWNVENVENMDSSKFFSSTLFFITSKANPFYSQYRILHVNLLLF
jgi:hypothetical protein